MDARPALEVLFRLSVTIRVVHETSVENVTLHSPLMDYEPVPNQRVKIGEVTIPATDTYQGRTVSLKGTTTAMSALDFVKAQTVTVVILDSLGSLGLANKTEEIVAALIDADWEVKAPQ